MTITYDLIIKTLTNNSIFSCKLNIMKYSSEFSFFKDNFDDSFYRYGVYQTNKDLENISLYSSIIFCIDDKYFNLTQDDILDRVNQFKQIGDIKNIVNSLNLNIIVFDFEKQTKSFYYNGEFFNLFKNTILLAKYENNWEPICSNDTKIFSYAHPKINIFKNKIIYTDSDIQFNDNIDEIIHMEFNQNIKNEECNESFTTPKYIYKNLTKNKLNKMKKEDIMQIINDLEIDNNKLYLKPSNKKPTKNDLIHIILNN
jgi:hypothetical protein